jgi:hypothetical protein
VIKFKIEEQDYYIDDFMSIENYSKIYKIKDLFTEEYFAAKLLNIVCGAPMQDLLECPFEDINYLASRIVSKMPNDKDIKFIDRFELDGVHYGFFPDWKELTFSEFIDMDTIATKKADELLDMLHYLAAIMYRPITEEISHHNFKIEKYDVDKMKVRAELFKKKLNVGVILGAQFFFTKYVKKYSNYTPPSLVTKKIGIWKQLKLIWMAWRMIYQMDSKKRSGGFLSSTKFLTMTLLNTNTSTKKT